MRLIQTALLGATCLVGASVAASAADIYRPYGGLKDEPVAYLPAIGWSGFYVGINGGYAWSAKSAELGLDGYSGSSCGGFCGSEGISIDSNGGFGGVQLGYNRQSGAFVYGIETDFQGAGIHGKDSLGFEAEEDNFSASAKTDLKWFGTVRGRLGYAFDNTLLYATGGFAYGKVHDQLTAAFSEDLSGAATTVSKSDTATGYVVGGGIEYKFSPSWSLKAEYQYINLGDTKLGVDQSFDSGEDVSSADLKAENAFHTVRIGLNYQFGAREEPLK